MKRTLLHLLFWFCYFIQFAYDSVLWDRSTFPKWSMDTVIFRSVTASLVFMIPQVLFPYYLIYRGINNIVRKKYSMAYNVTEILVVLFLCMMLDRALSTYVALPYIYKAPQFITPFFDIKRIFFSLMYLIFSFGSMYAIKSVRAQLDAKEKEKNLVKEKLETELKFLRNQTNPHFLLNTLNNIYALARKKSDDAPEAVMRLSELLRFMLYESNNNRIALSNEIKVLEDYLELETIRYNNRLTISFEKQIDNEHYYITPLLLLPFLENAFKHGISETRFESFINLCIKAKDGWLNFEIENTKDAGTPEKSATNIGLVNVKRQLELTYSDYKLNVTNRSDFFKVNLSVNLNSYVEI